MQDTYDDEPDLPPPPPPTGAGATLTAAPVVSSTVSTDELLAAHSIISALHTQLDQQRRASAAQIRELTQALDTAQTRARAADAAADSARREVARLNTLLAATEDAAAAKSAEHERALDAAARAAAAADARALAALRACRKHQAETERAHAAIRRAQVLAGRPQVPVLTGIMPTAQPAGASGGSDSGRAAQLEAQLHAVVATAERRLAAEKEASARTIDGLRTENEELRAALEGLRALVTTEAVGKTAPAPALAPAVASPLVPLQVAAAAPLAPSESPQPRAAVVAAVAPWSAELAEHTAALALLPLDIGDICPPPPADMPSLVLAGSDGEGDHAPLLASVGDENGEVVDPSGEITLGSLTLGSDLAPSVRMGTWGW